MNHKGQHLFVVAGVTNGLNVVEVYDVSRGWEALDGDDGLWYQDVMPLHGGALDGDGGLWYHKDWY